jgi:hypothetical protein
MQWAWIVLLAIVTLMLLLCITPINIQIRYTRKANRDHLHVQLRALFGLFTYTIVLPKLDLIIDRNRKLKVETHTMTGIGERPKRKRPAVTLLTEVISRVFRAQLQLTEKIHDFLPEVRKLTKVLKMVQFKWHSQLALADAAVTGTAAGALWAVKGSLLGLLTHFLSFQKMPDLSVKPSFDGISLETEVDCIIRFWLGQAIVAAIKMGIYLLREGKKPWQIIRYRV